MGVDKLEAVMEDGVTPTMVGGVESVLVGVRHDGEDKLR
jgi:hypothetical protein